MLPLVMYDLLGSNVEVGTVAVAVVLVGLVTRLYFGSVVFHPRYVTTWNIIRRLAAPILQRVVYRVLPFNIQIENSSTVAEYTATVDRVPKRLALTLDEVREVEVPLLNGFKTGPDGRTERATFVWYYGPKPVGSFPRWLRRYQVDVTVFERENGHYDLYAHREANSYRPDLWADHLLKGASFSAEDGVTRCQAALDDAEIDWVLDNPHTEAGGK